MKNTVLILLILLLGATLRFVGLDWDASYHLHPDERFLVMVMDKLRVPMTLSAYLDPERSTLNPRNAGFDFFVYGTWPLTVTRFMAELMGMTEFNDLNLFGRGMSATADLSTLLLVILIARILTRRYSLSWLFPLLAGFFYAIMVLPIQLAHFFTVDAFLVFFIILTLFGILAYEETDKNRWVIVASIAFGMALASKISALLILPLPVGILSWGVVSSEKFKLKKLILIAGFLFLTYGTLRMSDPTLFADTNWANPTIHPDFIEGLKTLKSLEGDDVWFPPAVQWINKPIIWYSTYNLAVFGLGLPLFFLSMAGLIIATVFGFRKKDALILLTLFWIMAFFLYQSTRFGQNMRYFLPLYPFFAWGAAGGLWWFLSESRHWQPFIQKGGLGLVGLSTLLWPAMFISIYLKPHPRVAATEWIYSAIPENSLILGEHWDDALPWPNPRWYTKTYRVELLPVFDPETETKWKTINRLWEAGDYYILSSNRGWGSIPTVPEKYPQTTIFYERLLSGQTEFKKIAEFTSYPSLTYIGIPIEFADDWADESFTVYDHPKVMVFEKL